ncbi:MAG: glycosyltransferase involved in cell wall biosynthesis [Candidatus Paceibacteria bacterium]|jgi:glycosyltransferase involved in cell wall biosynthesis
MEQKIQPKKILYVITKSNWGGAQKYVYELSTSLDKGKWETLVALGGEGDLKKRLDESGIQTIKLTGLVRDFSITKEWYVLLSLWKLFRKEKPDVVHLNSSKIAGLGSFAARLAGVKKIVFTAHGWAFNEERRMSYTLLIKFLSWVTILFSHKVIVLSEEERLQVSRWPFTKTKLNVIHTGVKSIDFEAKNIARLTIASKYPALSIHLNKKWIGNIAELHPNKGLIYAIDAMKEIDDAIYIIIGEGELYDSLKKYIEKNNLNSKIFLIGKVQDAGRYLKGFDFLLFPSIKEGLPYTLLEAGLAGSAVIASNVGGIPEIITQQETGLLFHPRQSKDIGRAIKHMMNNPDEAREFGEKLRINTETKFLFEKMLGKTTDLY